MKKTTPILIIICFGLFIWSVYSSFALSSANSQINQKDKTLKQLKAKKAVPSSSGGDKVVSSKPNTTLKTKDTMKTQLTKDSELTHNFFDRLFTYDNKTFSQRYKKAGQYCTNSVLINLIGEGSGHDGASDSKGGQPPTLVTKSDKSKEQVKMETKEVDFYYNTSDMEITTGAVKVVYDLWIDDNFSGETTSWYHVSIDTEQNKITKLSLFELANE